MAARLRIPRPWLETRGALPAVCLYTGATEGVSYRAEKLAARPYWGAVLNVPFALLIAYWSDLESPARWGLIASIVIGYGVIGARNPIVNAQLPLSDRAVTSARVRRVVRFVVGMVLAFTLIIAFLVWLGRRPGAATPNEVYLVIYAGVVALNVVERFLLVRNHEVRVHSAQDSVDVRIPSDAAVAAIRARLEGTDAPPPPEGARCAAHGDQPAAFTCPRCGSFACAACRHPAVPICGRCAAG